MLGIQTRTTRIRTRARDFPARRVLHSAVGRKKLGGEVSLADAGVGARKWILGVAEGAVPDARGIVDPCVGVQNGAALGAEKRVVGEDWELGGLHQWRAHDAERDD